MYIASARSSNRTLCWSASFIAERRCSSSNSSIGELRRFCKAARLTQDLGWSFFKLSSISFCFLFSESRMVVAWRHNSRCSSLQMDFQAFSRSGSSCFTLSTVSLTNPCSLCFEWATWKSLSKSEGACITSLPTWPDFILKSSSCARKSTTQSPRPFLRPSALDCSSCISLFLMCWPVFSESTSWQNIRASFLYSSLLMCSFPLAAMFISAASRRPNGLG
mmetsp:Transcript_93228/g.208699  ORF Transcript_93228/g.208699 Transcript_93228/m.208699 type:complete len:220 (-) Transcript_93228:2-661(-)